VTAGIANDHGRQKYELQRQMPQGGNQPQLYDGVAVGFHVRSGVHEVWRTDLCAK